MVDGEPFVGRRRPGQTGEDIPRWLLGERGHASDQIVEVLYPVNVAVRRMSARTGANCFQHTTTAG